MALSPFYDALEARPAGEREAALMAALPKHLAHAKQNAPGWARILKDVDAAAVTTRAALAQLPVTRKSELADLQKAMPPLGGLNATPPEKLAKLFVSPGPVYDPEGQGKDWWRTARSLYAAGFRPGDKVLNAFSYHFTPAASMVEHGALAVGCTVVPGGTGQTEMQAAAIRDLRLTAFAGTPSFLKLIMEKADELKTDVTSLDKAIVGAEYLPPALRQAMRARGIRVQQLYATADLGLLAYESALPDGTLTEGMILEESLILEIVRPGTGDPVPAGEVGEVVVTSLNADYPLIRFATGDLSAVLAGTSPCGRTNTRIKGWMGRADQTTKVRGMFVHPHQIADVVKRFPLIQRARVVVDTADDGDRMRVLCAVSNTVDGLKLQIETAVREITRLRGDVEFVEAQVLPNDGKVIEDLRKVS